MAQKSICLYTKSYPYGTGESFIENEIIFLSESFDKVYVFPLVIEGELRSVPKNVQVIELSKEFESVNVRKTIIGNLGAISRLFFQEIKHKKIYKKEYKIKFYFIVSVFSKANKLSSYLLEKGLNNAVHYTYWFDFWSSLLSILASRNKLIYFTRAHGYDLYEERNFLGYIHFRSFQMKAIDKVYCVSKSGAKYLKEKYPAYQDKVQYSYLGTEGNGMSPIPKGDKIRIVSCSNMIALKRVELIIEILKLIKLDVEWVHFGDGILLEDIKEKAKELPDNIESVFMGRKPNGNLLSYYQSTGVDLFINLSETEGLPVSIMEAISFGIPVIATDVGGTSEIVCNQTGWLINKEFTSSLVVSIIEENKEKYRTKEFRENIREYWKGNFRASKNYTDFYHNLAKKWGEK